MKPGSFTAERLVALYERVSDAENAIPLLRRFILDLAVRGKLVEQNLDDEPASDALKRISSISRGHEGRRKNTRETSAINTLEALPFSVPNSWTFAPLSRLTRVINGRAYKQQELLSSGTPVLRVGNLFTSNHWYYSDLELHDDKYCSAGDLIYAWSASFGPFIWDGPKAIFHYHIWKLDLFSEADLNKQYLFLFLQQKTREIKEAGHGVSMVHMTKEKMEKLAVPLPPLAEQQRIVAKVDELMALCDQLEAARAEREAVRDRLTAAALARLTSPEEDSEAFADHARFALETLPSLTTRQDQIKALRQTILDLAVRGKLVEQDATDEPAADLLSRISQERIQENPTKAKRRNNIRELDQSFTEKAIPHAWVWTRLDEVAISMRYGTSIKCETSTKGAPVLRIPNVSSGTLSFEELKYGPLSPSEANDLALRLGDILMIRSNGSLDIVGRSSVVTTEAIGMAFAGYLVRLRLSQSLLSAQYIWLVLNSSGIRAQIEKPIRSAVGLKNINLAEFGNLKIPLPPLAEQKRIVAKVNVLMALCDQLEASLIAARTLRTKLLETLLNEALDESSITEHAA